MKLNVLLKLLFFCLATCSLLTLKAQSDIKVGKVKSQPYRQTKKETGGMDLFRQAGKCSNELPI